MEEQIAYILKTLGSEGLTAFYVYSILNFLQPFGIFLMIGWGIKLAWPALQKIMDDFS